MRPLSRTIGALGLAALAGIRARPFPGGVGAVRVGFTTILARVGTVLRPGFGSRPRLSFHTLAALRLAAARLDLTAVGNRCAVGGHGAGAVEGADLACCGDRRRAVVHAGPERLVLGRQSHLARLRRCGFDAGPPRNGELLRGRARGDAARAPVIADAIYGPVVDHSPVIDVGDVHVGNVVHRTVVVKAPSTPLTAVKPRAGVAVAIVDAAVEPDVGSPVAGIENIAASDPAPIGRRPEESHPGWSNPDAGHPVVVIDARIPGPVAGGPDVAVAGDDRLRVDGQGRRRDADADAHGDLGLGGHGNGDTGDAEADHQGRGRGGG